MVTISPTAAALWAAGAAFVGSLLGGVGSYEAATHTSSADSARNLRNDERAALTDYVTANANLDDALDKWSSGSGPRNVATTNAVNSVYQTLIHDYYSAYMVVPDKLKMPVDALRDEAQTLHHQLPGSSKCAKISAITTTISLAP